MAATRHTALGIMSGSSLDGIDLALCTFTLDENRAAPIIDWRIDAAETHPYTAAWQQQLRDSVRLPAADFWRLHSALGDYIGRQAGQFLQRNARPAPQLVGCHGHTAFHEPGSGYSVQLGEGSRIAAHLHLPVVTDLRTADIAAGGQGAPLAPVADRHLFPDYRAFLNLGGIANFSLRAPAGHYLAGDVSGCCQILDRLAQQSGHPYDAGGQLARSGQYLPALAHLLRALPFHQLPYPKSLSNAWVVDTLWPILAAHPAPVNDRLHTFTIWLAGKIAADMEVRYEQAGGDAGAVNVLVSGGGTRNTFLVERLRAAGTLFQFTAGTDTTTDFKEAALIALCAVFRQCGIPNSLASATGAAHDTVNGALYAA